MSSDSSAETNILPKKDMHLRKYSLYPLFLTALLLFSSCLFAQQAKIHFTVSMQPEQKCFLVKMRYRSNGKKDVLFKMPAWTQGYYQIMRYADQVQQFTDTDTQGQSLLTEKKGDKGWIVHNNGADIEIQYQVKATRKFVAANFIDQTMAYLSPAGIFLHPDGEIKQQVLVDILPFAGWNKVATGLDLVQGSNTTYTASDYDVLYDSPFLLGANLEELPSFSVKGKAHHFIAYQPGDFDRNLLMQDIQKVVTAASDIIGDIPYEHYSFLAIGPGGGILLLFPSADKA